MGDFASLSEDAREDFVNLPEDARENSVSLSEDALEDFILSDASEYFARALEDGLISRSDPVPVDSFLSEDRLLSTGLEDLLFGGEVNSELLEQEEIESHMKKIVVLDDAEMCSVCLQDIDVGANGVALLKCNSHIFHMNCVVEWSKRKPNCPLCRHDMREERQRNLKRKRLPSDDDEELTRLKL
ncbi:hypothetical protein MKX03_009560 [Papaver bracteatum]|nr:hypothetical protein MKX03_009560 [Papaver bracteatum]